MQRPLRTTREEPLGLDHSHRRDEHRARAVRIALPQDLRCHSRYAAGVRVLFLADGFGCRDFARRYRVALRTAGAELAELRPVRWYELHRAQHRSHVRLVIIDGTTAYTGGFGLDDKWADGPGGRRGWRETNVRFTGPAVRQAQAAFFIAWAEATRELVAGKDFFPADTTAGTGAVAAIQFAGPGLGTTAFERLLFLTIAGARERLYITNSYFVPNAALRHMLTAAVARGVDVRVLTAGSRSDVPSTRLASRAYYGELLEAGVRLYEYRPTMMHAKTLVADGQWCVIGSMNFDNRSLRLNDEANLLVYDGAAAGEMERIFAADLKQAVEITKAAYAARPWQQQLLEYAAKLIAPLL
jgi:cardiolipin synthase